MPDGAVRPWQLHRLLIRGQPGERYPHDLLDLRLGREEVRRQPEEADERDHEDRGDVRVDRRKRPDQPRQRRVEADLLERLPTGGVGGRLPLVDEPSGEGDLAGMAGECVRPHREDQRRLGCLHERREHGCEPVTGRRQ